MVTNKRKNQVKGKGISKNLLHNTEIEDYHIQKRWKVTKKTVSGVFLRENVGFCPV